MLARAPDRVAETQWRLLAREARGAGLGQDAVELVELPRLLALGKRLLELGLCVEVILDHALVAPGDEDEVLDAGRARLVDDVLDHRPVDDGQHLLGHGLGGGKEARAEPGDGEDGFADALCGGGHGGSRLRRFF